MSWALEAIEKAAMERARRELPLTPVTVMGMSIATVAALRAFAYETLALPPSDYEPMELIRQLREHRK